MLSQVSGFQIFNCSGVFYIFNLFTNINITPRKSEQSVQFIFTQMFLKKKVKVNYLFNVFLRQCLLLKNRKKSDVFSQMAYDVKTTTRSSFLHDIFQQLDTVLFEDWRKMRFFRRFDANALRQVFVNALFSITIEVVN